MWNSIWIWNGKIDYSVKFWNVKFSLVIFWNFGILMYYDGWVLSTSFCFNIGYVIGVDTKWSKLCCSNKWRSHNANFFIFWWVNVVKVVLFLMYHDGWVLSTSFCFKIGYVIGVDTKWSKLCGSNKWRSHNANLGFKVKVSCSVFSTNKIFPSMW